MVVPAPQSPSAAAARASARAQHMEHGLLTGCTDGRAICAFSHREGKKEGGGGVSRPGPGRPQPDQVSYPNHSLTGSDRVSQTSVLNVNAQQVMEPPACPPHRPHTDPTLSPRRPRGSRKSRRRCFAHSDSGSGSAQTPAGRSGLYYGVVSVQRTRVKGRS